MGTTCGRENQPTTVKLPNVEMEPVEYNQEEQQNLSKSDLIPNQRYAKLVKERPKLLPAVSDSIALAGSPRIQTTTGNTLPVFYIPKKKGFYHGEWEGNLPHGKGRFYFNDGMYYEGDIKKGQATGDDCLLIYRDGSYKKGNMIDGKMEGKGTFLYKQKNLRYEGYWQNDEPHGEGKQTYGDDDFYYKGEFVNGKKHDNNGKMVWRNGKIYKGEFRDGYMQGKGKLYMDKGKGQYEGEFEKNLKQGEGKMKTQTGVYKGRFVNGEMEDENGQFEWFDDKVYRGGFKNGKLHGSGQITFKNGQKVQGQWENGENLWIDSEDRGRASSIRGSKLY